MIELYIVITMYVTGDYRTDEYLDKETCELHRDALRSEYKNDDFRVAFYCKKLIIHTSKNNPFKDE